MSKTPLFTLDPVTGGILVVIILIITVVGTIYSYTHCNPSIKGRNTQLCGIKYDTWYTLPNNEWITNIKIPYGYKAWYVPANSITINGIGNLSIVLETTSFQNRGIPGPVMISTISTLVPPVFPIANIQTSV
jgi:hypothetical protein